MPGVDAERKAPATLDARGRILETAYNLFSRFGVQAVGVDRIVAEAGVAKTTLYRHFRSKDELVVAVLDLREQLWTIDWLEHEVERRARTPRKRLLAIFDVFGEWFHRSDFEGCLFMSTLLEVHDRKNPVGAASVAKLGNVRAFVRELAKAAGVRDPKGFARRWQMLLEGSIVAAAGGHVEAAREAKDVAALLLQREASV
jgi:AcrR family transcriptional regulator